MSTDRASIATAPAAGGEINALRHLTESEVKEAEHLAKSLDVRDSLAITSFGIRPQRELTALADPILKMVATKDSGVAGEVLTELLVEIKELDAGSLPDQVERGLIRIPIIGGMFSKLKQFISRYEKISAKIDRTVVALEKSKNTLARDVVILDKMYDQNSLYFRQMLTYVAAGDIKLDALRIEQSGLAEQARISRDLVDGQKASDLSNAISRLERRVHDLKLSAMISLQGAPQIRLVQNSNQALMEKLQSSILTTIPLWKNQVVIAITLFDQQKAAKLQKEVSKATNELLRRNMEMLREGALDTARESERGIVEIETLRVINRQLIDTIEDALRIHEDGRAARMRVETELEHLQGELKSKLIDVRSGS